MLAVLIEFGDNLSLALTLGALFLSFAWGARR